MIEIFASDGSFDVKYDDGDIDTGLKGHCLRPFKAFERGDIVAVRDENDRWTPGTIEDVHGPGGSDERILVDVRVNNLVLEKLTSSDLRRFEPEEEFQVGDAVTAKFKDKQWYPGFIEEVNSDGTYGVIYTDGDREARVEPDMVRRRIHV